MSHDDSDSEKKQQRSKFATFRKSLEQNVVKCMDN